MHLIFAMAWLYTIVACEKSQPSWLKHKCDKKGKVTIKGLKNNESFGMIDTNSGNVIGGRLLTYAVYWNKAIR